MPDPVEPVTAEELSLFLRLKDELASALKENGSGLFDEKTCKPFTGLVNQGATCYMVRQICISITGCPMRTRTPRG
jgi:hypothetical protein